ncbi:MAG TPA: ABC transporter substrate-binding protein, partial [Pseudonocardiaceae bacterium]|nr:ABC transporter substrate-binding protein [Pseudonocardiaceae bacterium]
TGGMIFEPLYYFDTVDASRVSPWLATAYKWSPDGTSITFTLRSGVTWSDGQPFTSADVAFTFQLAITNKALNQFNLPLTSVATPDPHTVTLSFSRPEFSDLFFIAGKTFILPKHVWSGVSDPATFANATPVGTGAYVVSSVTPEALTLTANPHYYQPNMPKFKTVRFLSYKDNNASNAALAAGELDWGGNYIPNVQRNYLAKNPNFRMINIPLSVAFLVPNYKNGPTAALPVRQAISAALQRGFISKTVYDGNAPATNPMALLTPNYSNVLDPSLANRKLPAGDPNQAKDILTHAGYTLGSDGTFRDPAGAQLTIQLQVIQPYTDYVQIVQIAQQELKAAGINLVVDAESGQQFNNNKYNGNFQLLIDNYGYTPSPYTYYYDMLDSALAPRSGTPDLVGNYGGYANPAVDAALTTIASTTDLTTQKKAFATIEQQFIRDVPLIPLFEQQNEQEFNGNVVAGYPTADNPYASTAIYLQPDLGWVMMRLTPAAH